MLLSTARISFQGHRVAYRRQWFPHAAETRECCDPAGAHDAVGAAYHAIQILRDHGIDPQYENTANRPDVRLAMVERIAGQMRKRVADRQDAHVVSNSDRWLRVSAQSTIVDGFLADGRRRARWTDGVSAFQVTRPVDHTAGLLALAAGHVAREDHRRARRHGTTRTPGGTSDFRDGSSKRSKSCEISGEPGGNRTHNPQIKSLLLCQLSYRPGKFAKADRGADRAPRKR